MSDESIKEIVKQKYGRAALRVVSGDGACCSPASSRGDCDPITSKLYEAGEITDPISEGTFRPIHCQGIRATVRPRHSGAAGHQAGGHPGDGRLIT